MATPLTPERITLRALDGASLVRITGDLDLEVLPELRDALQAALDQSCWVIADLAGAGVIASVGLGPLLAASRVARRNGGDLLLASPSPLVRTTLRAARLENAFRVFPTVPQAMTVAFRSHQAAA